MTKFGQGVQSQGMLYLCYELHETYPLIDDRSKTEQTKSKSVIFIEVPCGFEMKLLWIRIWLEFHRNITVTVSG